MAREDGRGIPRKRDSVGELLLKGLAMVHMRSHTCGHRRSSQFTVDILRRERHNADAAIVRQAKIIHGSGTEGQRESKDGWNQ